MQMPETEGIIQEAAAHGFALTKEAGSNFYRIPADFLIGPNLIVQYAHYARYVTDHLPYEVIEQFIAQEVV